MPNTYRADDRSGNEIQQLGGFPLWIPEFTVDMAREIIRIYAGTTTLNQCSQGLRDLHTTRKINLQDLVANNQAVNPGDLMRWIVSEKDRNRPTISTSLSPDCGGYAVAPRYRFTINGGQVQQVNWNTAVPGANVNENNIAFPQLYLNGGNLANSNVIAVLSKQGGDSREMTFFTSIPWSVINNVEHLQ